VEYQVDPYETFHNSDSILSRAEGFEYSFRYVGTGSLANIIPVHTGETILSRSPLVAHPLMVLDFLVVESADASRWISAPASYIATEDSLYRFDFTLSTVASSPADRTSSDIFNYPPASVMMELVIDNPFADELMADSIAVLFPDTVFSEPCHVFHVYYSGGETQAIWHISRNDLLPRAVERLGPSGGELLEIWNLREASKLLASGEQAPEVFLANTNGFTERIAFPGDNRVLLLFFTPEGTNSLKALGTAAELRGEDIEVYGISLTSASDIQFMLRNLDIPFTVLIHGENTAKNYNVGILPSAVLIDRDGMIILSAEGFEAIDSAIGSL